MTPAQLRAENGPINEITLGVPMTWKAFKAVKDDNLKRQYLEDLCEKYRPTDTMLGDMFGISRCVMNMERRRLDVKGLPASGQVKRSQELRDAWDAFLHSGVDNTVEDVENADELSGIPGVPPSGNLDHVELREPTAEEMEELLKVLKSEPCVIPRYEGERYAGIGTDDFNVPDPVNHPSHYTQGGIECIEAIKALTSQFNNGYVGYLAGTVLKYLWRHPFKGNPVQDIDKAVWYLTSLADYMKEDNNRD